jgi:hypothetical protein
MLRVEVQVVDFPVAVAGCAVQFAFDEGAVDDEAGGDRADLLLPAKAHTSG